MLPGPPPPPPPPNPGQGVGAGHGPNPGLGPGYTGAHTAQQRSVHQQMAQQVGAHGPNGLSSQIPGSQMPMGYPGMHPISFSPTFHGVTFTKVTDRATLAGRAASWALAKKTELPLSSEDLARQVRAHRGRTHKSAGEEYLDLRSDKMRMQIDTLLQGYRRKEQNINAEWTLASIEVKLRNVAAPRLRSATEAYLMTVILRRSPKNSDGIVDDAGFEIGGIAGETIDVDRPRFVEPRPSHFPNPPMPQVQLNQRMPGQQVQPGQGIPSMQQQQQHLQQGAFPQQGQVPGKQAKAVPQIPNDMHGLGNQGHKTTINQSTPKLTKANGQPLGPKIVGNYSDDEVIHIIEGKNKQKKYPAVPRPPGAPLGIGKGQTLSRKSSLKNMQDPRRTSTGQEYLLLRDPKLTKVEKEVKRLKNAMGRKNTTDSDLDSDYTDTTDDSYEMDDHGTPPSSADDNSLSRRLRRDRRRRLSESWNGRRSPTERMHRKPHVTRRRSSSLSRRMSLPASHHTTEPTIVKVPVPIYHPLQVPSDYADRPPLMERRGTYHDSHDFPSRPRTLQRSLTFDNHLDMARDRSGLSRRYVDEMDDRDLVAQEYMARNSARAKEHEYIRRGDSLDDARRRDSEVRALERMELERLMNNRGDEELDRRMFERAEMRKRINDMNRYEDMLRLEEKMRDMRTEDLVRERVRRGDGSIGHGMY